jgi:hypothetical protein
MFMQLLPEGRAITANLLTAFFLANIVTLSYLIVDSIWPLRYDTRVRACAHVACVALTMLFVLACRVFCLAACVVCSAGASCAWLPVVWRGMCCVLMSCV